MQRQHRLLALALSIVMLLAACGPNTGSDTPEPPTEPAPGAEQTKQAVTTLQAQAAATAATQTQQAAVVATLTQEATQPLLCTDAFGDDANPCGIAINKKITGSDWTGETLRQDGAFTVTGTRAKPEGGVWQVFKLQNAPHLTDFYMKVDVKFTPPNPGNTADSDNTAGIAFHASDDTRNYYLFEFKNSGDYRSMLYSGGSGKDLIPDQDFQPSEAFTPNGSNRIEVLAHGNHFEIYVNGQRVQAYDDTEYSSGFAGLFVRFHAAGDTATWQFDNLELHAPELAIPSMQDFSSLPNYRMLYDFSSGQDIDPVFSLEQPKNCAFDDSRGVAWLTCDSTTDKQTYFRLWPRSKEPIRGVAILAHVDSPYDETWARPNPYLHFTLPGGSDTRQYGMSLRKGISWADEFYPKDGWKGVDLAKKEIPPDQQGQFHLIQMEFTDGSMRFFLDGQPMMLDINQPNLPGGAVLDWWSFEVYLNKEPADAGKTISMQIAWIAVLK